MAKKLNRQLNKSSRLNTEAIERGKQRWKEYSDTPIQSQNDTILIPGMPLFKNKKREKFLEGGRIHNYVEDPIQSIYENNLMIDQAIAQAAMETEGLKMLGEGIIGLGSQLPGIVGGFKKTFDKAKTGVSMKLQGPNHEQGGVPLNIMGRGIEAEGGEVLEITPEDATIFSKRFGTQDKKGNFVSFADAKEKRDKENQRDIKKATDAIGKNTYNRREIGRKVEEENHKNAMDLLFQTFNSGQRESVKAAGGIGNLELLPGNPGKETLDDYLRKIDILPTLEAKKQYAKNLGINYTGKNDSDLLNRLKTFADKNVASYKESSKSLEKIAGPDLSSLGFPVKTDVGSQAEKILSSQPNLTQMIKDGKFPEYKKPDNVDTSEETSSQFPYTSGDLLGMLGNAYQAYTNKASANAEIATDQPNINPYEGFGEDSLNANSEAMGYIGQMRDNALRNASLEANSAQKRGRGMSRSANTARAMDISISGNKNLADSKIWDAFAQQMMALFGQKSHLENQQDAYTMQGREKQDMNDRADKAGRNMVSRDANMFIGKALSDIGGNINTAKGNKATEKLINSMSMYGKYNSMTGELSFDTGGIDRMVEDGTWKNTMDATGKSPSTVAEFRKMAKNGKLKVKA